MSQIFIFSTFAVLVVLLLIFLVLRCSPPPPSKKVAKYIAQIIEIQQRLRML